MVEMFPSGRQTLPVPLFAGEHSVSIPPRLRGGPRPDWSSVHLVPHLADPADTRSDPKPQHNQHKLLCRHFVSSEDVRLRTLRLPLHRLHWESLVQRLPVQSRRPLHPLSCPLPLLLTLLWRTVCSQPRSELITHLSTSKYFT